MKPKLILVFPSMFESDNLTVLLGEVERKLLASYDLSVFVLDDSCGQDKLLYSLQDNFIFPIQVITHQTKLGHQRAISNFFKKNSEQGLKDTFITTLDADGEDRIEDIIPMLEILKKDISKVVLAKRLSRARGVIYRLCFKIYQGIFYFISNEKILSGNFACLHSSYLPKLIQVHNFDVAYSSSFYFFKGDIVFYPCHKGKRIKGDSKMSLGDLVVHAYRMTNPFKKIIVRKLLIFLVLVLITIFFLIMVRMSGTNSLGPV